jgi:hypothetical protein
MLFLLYKKLRKRLKNYLKIYLKIYLEIYLKRRNETRDVAFRMRSLMRRLLSLRSHSDGVIGGSGNCIYCIYQHLNRCLI